MTDNSHITHDDLEDKLNHEKNECRLEFMTQKAFYRSIVIGIITSISLITTAIAWAVNDVAVTSKQGQIIEDHSKRISKVEDQITAQHKEQMRILVEIKSELKSR